jgi:NAD(P)-dependent dehydrogenase (short-subunit alcohol dehydrogenase family)
MNAGNLLFEGKVVVVTGAGSGVGRGFAVGFARDGAQVVGFSRTVADLACTAELCGPGKMHGVVGSVAVEADVDRLFAETMQRYGRVDILVNNAALYPKIGFLESPWSDWAQVIETNVLGMALCCRKALPGMMERGHGRIINIGTFAWRGPIPDASAYSVSKAAVPVLTKAIAVEIDRERYPDVLVNELVPGIYRTRMSDAGEDPMDAYAHARVVASLPSGGPTGSTFVRSELWVEHVGIRAKLRRILAKLAGG